jgi:hypothetical protein
MNPEQFTLVVNDFGVKYISKADVNHLIASIKSTYTLTKDWTSNMYCGIKLSWVYKNQTVNILMLGYIKKLQEYEHILPKSHSIVRTHLSQNNSEERPKNPI